MRRLVALLALLLLTSTACTNMARVKLRDGTRVRGKILHNNDGKLALYSKEAGLFEVRTDQVEDIDHPGDSAYLAATLVGIPGVLGAADAESPDGAARAASVLGTAAGLLLYGFITELKSKRRAEPFESKVRRESRVRRESKLRRRQRLGPRRDGAPAALPRRTDSE